jgi:hypothetical protein
MNAPDRTTLIKTNAGSRVAGRRGCQQRVSVCSQGVTCCVRVVVTVDCCGGTIGGGGGTIDVDSVVVVRVVSVS